MEPTDHPTDAAPDAATAPPAPADGTPTPAGDPAATGMAEPTAAAPTSTDPAAGVGQPMAAAPPPPPRAKTKGVADIVFLLDVSGSMALVIDALRRNIEVFIDSLSTGDANNAAPVKDWRGRVVGYRDAEHDRDWYVDNPFVRDAVALKAQLA